MSVLPALINELEAVAIGVDYVGRIVARIVVKSGSGCAVVCATRRDCGSIGSVDPILTVGHKANVRGVAVHYAFLQPEEYATVCTEPFQVGMSWRAILAVIIEALIDAKGIQSALGL